MIYAILHIFQTYAAFVTASDEAGFRDVIREVVRNCLHQVEERSGRLEGGHRERIENEMAAWPPVPCDTLSGFTYDLGFDVHGLAGKIVVGEVYFSEMAVIQRFQPWVDACNQELESEEERYAVFDGGFFPSTQGYEMDELLT